MESPAAKAPSLEQIEIATDYGSWFWFIFLTVIFAGIWFFINNAVNVAEVSSNWPKYRCTPSVMPFAAAYGHDTAENFNFCIKQIFQGQVGGVTGPFGSILSTMITNMMVVLKSVNSLRVMLATLVGGITKIAQEFKDRFKLALSQLKLASAKIQYMMRRLFATFYSVIYMGLSAVMVGQNFSETFIFKFLDTFCFAPETLIEIEGRGKLQIQDVVLGDVCANGARVLSTYRFLADGQSMVWIDKIQVSSNHMVLDGRKWVEAENHTDAWPGALWRGGVERPLVCLDTESHQIPIDDWIFSDWDETHDSDEAVMRLAEEKLNGVCTDSQKRPWKYQPAFHSSTQILLKSGALKCVADLKLGDELSTGKVSGLGKRLVKEAVLTDLGTTVTPSTLVWKDTKWIRAGHHALEVHPLTIEEAFYVVFVLGSASIETATGEVFRDMLEVHSPDMELPTLSAMGAL